MTGNKIPKHWQKTSLGKILSISSGNGLTKLKRNDEGEYLVYGGNGVTGKHSQYLFEEEKLIIGRVGVHCGNAYITKPKSWVTDNAFVVSFDETEINKIFLLNLIGFLNLNKYSVSTAQPVLSQGKLYPIEVAIPPLLEQQAIVAKIEELLSELENGKEQLKIAQQQLKIYRQSLLKCAFEGKLTNKRVKDGELPKSWKWVTADDVTSKITDGEHSTPKRVLEGEMLLSAKNVRDGYIDYSNFDCISKLDFEKCLLRCNPEVGDILIVCVGATIGRASIVKEKRQFALVRSVALLKPQSVVSNYLLYYIQSPQTQKRIQELSQGSAQNCLYLNKIKQIQIPLPPLKEQQQIVEELESKLTVCNKIEETISQSLQQTETLKQSILKKAFEGKLITIEKMKVVNEIQ